MNSVHLAIENVASPAVLAFVLGALAVLVKSDLKLPDPIHTWLATYLLLAIGLRGGHELRDADPGQLILPALATVAIGVTIPVVVFLVARPVLRVSLANAGSLAAHYGSVSVVTFTAALVFASEAKFTVEPFMTTLVALLEIPGIIVALLLVSLRRGSANWRSALREVLTGRSVLLLVGGLIIGAASSNGAYDKVAPFFVGLFAGILVLFLLDMGATAAGSLKRAGGMPWRVVLFALVAPLVFGAAAVCVGIPAGLSAGGAAVLGAMGASASYIAAPAAVRIAIPDADPGLALGAALGVTFPLNLAIGIPVYFALADLLAH